MGKPLIPASARRGRPRKFNRPSRAVTLTLPEDVLARLGAVDTDLARAIVSVVEGDRHQTGTVRPAAVRPAEISSFGHSAVIIVTPVRALRRLPGVQLVPIGHGRCLISLVPPHSIPQLELDIRDVIAEGDATRDEQRTLEGIADILRAARASGDSVPQERTIIVLESKRHRRYVRRAS